MGNGSHSSDNGWEGNCFEELTFVMAVRRCDALKEQERNPGPWKWDKLSLRLRGCIYKYNHRWTTCKKATLYLPCFERYVLKNKSGLITVSLSKKTTLIMIAVDIQCLVKIFKPLNIFIILSQYICCFEAIDRDPLPIAWRRHQSKHWVCCRLYKLSV